MLEWILDREGHEFLVHVDRSFIRNEENLYGLLERVNKEMNISKEVLIKQNKFQLYVRHLYKAAAPTSEHLSSEHYLQFIQDLVDIYGLIHSRYIRTPEGKFNAPLIFTFLTVFLAGMAKMLNKYLEGVFGICPRALCNGQKCLPVGLSDKLRSSRVKIFCPKCDEVYMVQKYKPPQMPANGKGAPSGGGVQTATNLDGAYFGSSFPQEFITWNEVFME